MEDASMTDLPFGTISEYRCFLPGPILEDGCIPTPGVRQRIHRSGSALSRYFSFLRGDEAILL